MKIGIVGDGLTGMLLAWELQQAGCDVVIMGTAATGMASEESAAVLTPLANRKHDILPDYQRLLDIALEMYTDIGTRFGRGLVHPLPILKQGSLPGDAHYFEVGEEELIVPYWQLAGPFLSVRNAWKVDAGIVNILRNYFGEKECYVRRKVDWSESTLKELKTTFDLIVCCEGAAVRHNPLFSHLPFTKNKGDVMQLYIPMLSGKAIYDFEYKLVPMGQEGMFWMGSNNIWHYDEVLPEPSFRTAAEKFLSRSLKVPFSVLKHIAVERPTIAGQQAVARPHPEHTAFWCVNGLGARGFLKAPALVKEVLTGIL